MKQEQFEKLRRFADYLLGDIQSKPNLYHKSYIMQAAYRFGLIDEDTNKPTDLLTGECWDREGKNGMKTEQEFDAFFDEHAEFLTEFASRCYQKGWDACKSQQDKILLPRNLTDENGANETK